MGVKMAKRKRPNRKPAKATQLNIEFKKPEPKVRKSNALIEGRYRFNLNEQKVLLSILSRIKPMDTEFKPYIVPWSEIKRVTNDRITTAQKLHDLCENLKNKTVLIEDGKRIQGFGFLSGWTIDPGKQAEFRIDPGMQAMLLDLLENGNFTLYDLECVLSLSSVYSVRIYEMFKAQEFKKQPVVITLDKLKWSLDIATDNKTYSDFGSFRRAVIDKAQSDLKVHTDISFTYNPLKEGRRVVALEVTIRENKKFQRTVPGASAGKLKDQLQDGDIIQIAGKDYEFNGGVVMMSDGVLPLARLHQLLDQGKAKIKKG